MIKLENVSKSFKKISLFNGVTIEINDGDKVYIKGINGSGKSVLLKIISGFSRPSSGSVLIDGKVLGTDFDFIPDAGISINAPEFMNNWTGMENLRYLANIKKKTNDDQIIGLAAKLSMDTELEKKYKTYSLGMKQKMRIIQALIDEPRYLILDEPFDALDKSSRENVLVLLNEYLVADSKRTLIYTSHNESMEKFSNKVFEIDNNSLVLVR